jgi:hypothetical protein
MVSKNEVIPEFHHPLDIIWVVFLEQEEQLGFHRCLIIVFLLILDKFDGDQLLVLMVQALDNLSEGSLTDDLDQLEPVSDVVTFLNSVVPLFVIKAVIYKSLQLCRFDLVLILSEVIQILILVNLSPLKICEVLGRNLLSLGGL